MNCLYMLWNKVQSVHCRRVEHIILDIIKTSTLVTALGLGKM